MQHSHKFFFVVFMGDKNTTANIANCLFISGGKLIFLVNHYIQLADKDEQSYHDNDNLLIYCPA